MIFKSLVCANECVHVHNLRDFPQARLDSEIKARFLLNKHSDQYFLLLCSLFCPQILYIIPYASGFHPVKFSPKYYFDKLCFQLPQNVVSIDE